MWLIARALPVNAWEYGLKLPQQCMSYIPGAHGFCLWLLDMIAIRVSVLADHEGLPCVTLLPVALFPALIDGTRSVESSFTRLWVGFRHRFWCSPAVVSNEL